MMKLQSIALALAVGDHQHDDVPVRVDKAARGLLIVDFAFKRVGAGGATTFNPATAVHSPNFIGRRLLISKASWLRAIRLCGVSTTASSIADSIAAQARSRFVGRFI